MWICRRFQTAIVLVAALAFCGFGGCVGPQIPAMPQHMQNPVFVPASDYDVVWESAVDVMHSLQLPIRRESKLDGVIETDYKVGAGLLEPWHQDAVTFSDRLEGSFQSIRRRAVMSITPAQGGFLVGVEVVKEIENPDKLIINSPGHSTFQTTPLQRDLNVVIGPATPDGWIPRGRDPGLEQSILARLQAPGTY
ncbi:MAG: hypothetical protein O3B68_14695 [Planctomycetota bacterium]|nr:hypothetical protein [Planctomycetota bacterium]